MSLIVHDAQDSPNHHEGEKLYQRHIQRHEEDIWVMLQEDTKLCYVHEGRNFVKDKTWWRYMSYVERMYGSYVEEFKILIVKQILMMLIVEICANDCGRVSRVREENLWIIG